MNGVFVKCDFHAPVLRTRAKVGIGVEAKAGVVQTPRPAMVGRRVRVGE